MPNRVKIGLLAPTHYAGDMPSPREFIDWFQAAEGLGFDSLWVLDRIFGSVKTPDAMTILALAAGVTSRVRLGTGVILLPHRNPILFAKEVATLDYISGGRVDLGIGLGGREGEFTALGIRMEERVGRFRENLAIMRKLWAEPDVSFQGRYHTFDGVTLEPRPTQPSIPIYVGGEVDAVLKRTAELADGWLGGSRNDPRLFSEKRRKIRDFARAGGRDPDALDCGNLVYLAVGEDRDELRGRLKTYTSAIYGPQYDVDQYTTFGSSEQCAARLQEYIEAGATHLVLGPPDLDIGWLNRVGQEVVSKLKR